MESDSDGQAPVTVGVGSRNAKSALSPTPPLKVSRTKRIVQVLVAVIYCLLAAGIVFGYAAIKPVLIHEGVYRDRCTKDELDQGVRTCYEQEIRSVHVPLHPWNLR